MVKSDKVEVDGKMVFSADVTASNIVVHSIGEVLVQVAGWIFRTQKLIGGIFRVVKRLQCPASVC